MHPPTHRSPRATPALVFVILVAVALAFGSLNELVHVGGRGGPTREIVIGALGALVSGLMLTSAIALWQGVANARRLAVATTVVTLGWCAYVMLPGNRIVGMLALLLSVLASAVLAWIARRGIDFAPGPQPG
jgi:hypothetical protein